MKLAKHHALGVSLICAITLSGCSSKTHNSNAPVVLNESYYTDLYDWNKSKGLNKSFLGRGINMGNFFESPNYEGEWNGDLTIQASDFDNIASHGFASVRIPVRWNAHALENAPFTIDTAFLSRVQQVVDEAIQEDLRVIINTHHYNEMFYNKGEFQHHRQRLNAIWNQLAIHFPLDEYPEDKLVFELLNEPHEEVGVDQWNLLIDDLTSLLWKDSADTQNNSLGQRKIMIGTADWGGPFKLPDLKLPQESTPDNTIITVHFYEPFKFTHQGAEWVDGASDWAGMRWLGIDAEKQTLYNYLDAVSAWNNKQGRGFEINIGEFGVYSKVSNPLDQRAWTAFIARESEKRSFSWHYWEYSSGFGAYDPIAKQWRSALIEGLIPTDK
ncbi:glycoside hydrolase family 5 protein [Vibrio cyclitrophicus]|nr:glycoside hydrolase family 5 protein [Vibrio cyclitrophicus]UPR33764.1 glycoside hydrolase family 5 protein [Vibrio cyclitrophicus]UPR46670.1 glycoside hydrolase family 5 protein [Vibrio cyclitrophicus]